ncbi:hypothetical protein NA57DRAFT_76053 [Rhizodiscina lignyota]|uniref:Xylanolytic transcriptional activator regulatory domain-containing protein n=1 Tax=Rhizodiscina lignyota TaxID=1504668 RepID=A0A9P4M6F0_9PEZI|nr:hypothetical protein NA57DRAFT_76053 [Rhizodiscina lignyota]
MAVIDRRQPCTRCARGDRGDKCVYEAVKKPRAGSQKNGSEKEEEDHGPDPFSVPKEKMVKYRKGKVRHGGRTHWALIAHEFQEMRQFMSADAVDTTGINKQLKSMKKFFPKKRLLNYPFCPSREPRYTSQEGIISTLPDRSTVQSLVDIYFETFEKTHALFHEATFKETLSLFWEHPESVESGWLASLFLMLALSHHASKHSSAETVTPATHGQIEAYLESGQAALHLTGFMLKPTLDSLRALCIVAIGKALDIITLDDSDTLYIFTGFIVRYAFLLGMHRDPKYATGMPPPEAQARRKIWTTILFLDLRISIEAGMPLLIRSTDYDTLPPQDTFGALVFESQSISNELTPTTFQHKLAQSIRIVADIIAVINSPSPDLKYEQVLNYDAKLRAVLRDFPTLNPNFAENTAAHLFQRSSLSIFIHRVLLALHQPYATDPQVWRDYQTSHYSVLQCSLAILGIQRLIFECSELSVPVMWLHELYRHDFMVAALYVCVALRRDQFSGGQGDGLSKEQAKQTAWDTLLGCREIWQRDCTLSVHHYKIYLGMCLITAAISSLEKGNEPLDAMKEVAGDVIAEVTDKLGASSHPSTGSSEAATSGSGSGPLDFMLFDGWSMDPTFFSTGIDPMTPDLHTSWGPAFLGGHGGATYNGWPGPPIK